MKQGNYSNAQKSLKTNTTHQGDKNSNSVKKEKNKMTVEINL